MKALPIELPSLSLDELNRLTNNFSEKSLVGEGSYGRVFHATLSDGQQAAVKKLDTTSAQDSDSEFAAQVARATLEEKRIQCMETSSQRSLLLMYFLFYCSYP